MTLAKPPIRLIVNADDFGYFPCVSRGIAEAARLGAVNATGIMANSPALEAQIGWLAELENLDLGVHLNLTSGRPLTMAMAGRLESSGGRFPGVFSMAGMILARQIPLALVREEWRAQIETLLRLGLDLQFLNSHEHVHMLPGLFGLALDLAAEYNISHLRLARTDWLPPLRFPAVVRGGIMQTLARASRLRATPSPVRFIGLGGSGRLDLAYLRRLFATLKPGGVYELMCHPGRFDPAEIADPRLLAYHAWEQEFSVLTGPGIQALYAEYGIQLAHYRSV